MKPENLRTMVVTTNSGKDVKDTNMLKGEAKDSLSGTNDTGKEYTSQMPAEGKLGGMPSRS